MGLWDTLTGRPSGPKPDTAASNSPSSGGSTPTLQDTAPTSSFTPSFEAQDSSALLNTDAISKLAALHPLAGLDSTSLDYLTLEDSTLSDLPGAQSALPSRGWSDDLCYGTGATYMSALAAGGAWGFVEGSRRTPPGAPFRLQLNTILNSVTRRGPFLGNSAGVIALVYNGINSTIGAWRGKHDWANSITAGALSGMIFKSTRGLRPMLISGGIVAGMAAGWTVSTLLWQKFEMNYANEGPGFTKVFGIKGGLCGSLGTTDTGLTALEAL